MASSIRVLLACLVVAGSAMPLFAEEGAKKGDQAALVEKRDKKLQEPWLKKAPWITDYDKALAESRKAGKPVFAYFTRSYAY